MTLRFGTDGIRGVANTDLTPEFAVRLGRALAANVAAGPFIIARDTRLSGDMLEGALIAGLLSSGRNVLSAGIMPTPALAFLTRMSDAAVGVMISASHNPIEDNGFKCFDARGFKLSDDVERAIEASLVREKPQARDLDAQPTLRRDTTLTQLYIDAIVSLGVQLSGYTVVLDTAFGAAYEVAPAAFRALGANVVVINGEADGARINVECGATDMRMLAQEVMRIGSSRTVGIAFDGDADRVRFVDERGRIIDGDAVLLAMARDLKERGQLFQNTLVGTVMSNLAFEHALAEEAIELVRTPVGDRYVLQSMQELGANFGGEPSGHIIDLRRNTTGDGPGTAIAFLSLLARKDMAVSELVADYRPYPQLLVNVRLAEYGKVHEDSRVKREIDLMQEKLGSDARILIRPSGTEPLVRVMVEGPDEAEVSRAAHHLADTIRSVAGIATPEKV